MESASTPSGHSRLSSTAIRELAADASGEITIIPLTDNPVCFHPGATERISRVLHESGAAMVYTDYYISDNGKTVLNPLIAWQEGALRDDFDFGMAVAVPTTLLRETVSEMTATYAVAGWYDLRLRLSRKGQLLHLPEPMYTVTYGKKDTGKDAHFAYVDPRNRASQIEMEKAVTAHLSALGALVDISRLSICDIEAGDFGVEASVVIPVRNRRRTIADAVHSALGQHTDFPFNVIVVDNRSDDGTSGILAEIATADPRLRIIDTATVPGTAPGIGGCWNLALQSPYCGRFAVQLDSDDLYSGPDTLAKIVRKFREEHCAMVIGSYTLTDFDGNIIAPGLIDHAEWTDENGPNNALRINGLGAPRAFHTPVARAIGFPDVCYGEDYAMGLAISRLYHIGRIYDSLYLCRRWEDNTDHALSVEKVNRNNLYKDSLRTIELNARRKMNSI